MASAAVVSAVAVVVVVVVAAADVCHGILLRLHVVVGGVLSL